jgi:protein-L-isoaspartate(D-aspartate) O-methyltransferase
MLHAEHLIQQLIEEGITESRVLEAILHVPREAFVMPGYTSHAYDNTPLPIDCEQTISQPYIVALMTQALIENGAQRKILEIGTGSGYQTAILASIFDEVWSVERIKVLQAGAKKILTKLGYDNIHFLVGDGSHGWKQGAPFDGIIVTAAAPEIPKDLLAQMDPLHSVLIIPVGEYRRGQRLMCVTQHDKVVHMSVLSKVSFVPLISDDEDEEGSDTIE